MYLDQIWMRFCARHTVPIVTQKAKERKWNTLCAELFEIQHKIEGDVSRAISNFGHIFSRELHNVIQSCTTERGRFDIIQLRLPRLVDWREFHKVFTQEQSVDFPLMKILVDSCSMSPKRSKIFTPSSIIRNLCPSETRSLQVWHSYQSMNIIFQAYLNIFEPYTK